MATIRLNTPKYRQDETVTEFEANDIVHVVSVVGNDEAQGTHFYLRGIPGRQFCLESATDVKRLVAAHRDASIDKSGHVIHIGTVYGGVQVDSPNATQHVNITVNQQLSEAMRNLRTAVESSDLDEHDKDEIRHTLDRVKQLAASQQTAKSKSSILEKLTVVEKMVSVSEKLGRIALPLTLVVRAHVGA